MNSRRLILFRGRTRALALGLMLAVGMTATRGDTTTAPIQGSWLSQKDLLSIGIDQRLGEQIPAGLRFTDAAGEPVDFDALLARKPTILALVYYNCPNLCTLVLNGVVLSIGDLRRDLGDGFQVVSVSIDPTETPAMAAQKKKTYLRRYGRGGAAEENWHFLVGDQANVAALAAAVGYRYRYDPAIHQYAHGSGIMVLDEQRRLVKYFLGIEYPPAELENALVLAQRGGTGAPVQNFLLLCYCYNPLTGPYGFLIFTILKVAAAATVLGLGGFIIFQLRRELRGRALP